MAKSFAAVQNGKSRHTLLLIIILVRLKDYVCVWRQFKRFREKTEFHHIMSKSYFNEKVLELSVAHAGLWLMLATVSAGSDETRTLTVE